MRWRGIARVGFAVLGGLIGGVVITHVLGLVFLLGLAMVYLLGIAPEFWEGPPPPSVVFGIAPDAWEATIFVLAVGGYGLVFGVGFVLGFRFAYRRYPRRWLGE